ncbi:hypothetical protein B0H12DRAFT_231051 [Mycena haematopus]|nr:hypothetical protein B0H12DRAFT_231051 [Mycena haematopus]
MRAAPHVLFPALVLAALYTLTVEAQANRTVDDFAPLITYTPAADVTHLDTTGFDVTKLYNGTIGIMNSTDTMNMTMQFTGTAVWLFVAKPQTTDTFSDAYTIYLDGAEVDDVGDVDLETDAEYNNVAYSNEALHLGPHVVTLAAQSVVYFDYAVFTCVMPLFYFAQGDSDTDLTIRHPKRASPLCKHRLLRLAQQRADQRAPTLQQGPRDPPHH